MSKWLIFLIYKAWFFVFLRQISTKIMVEKKNCKLWEWCRPHTMSKCAIKIDLGCRQKREKDKPSKKQRQ